MKAIERFYQYLEYKGIKPTRFEKDNGLSNGYLATQLKRNGTLGENVLNKILDNCLELDPVWLLTGKGDMIICSPYEENSIVNFVNEPREPFLKSKPNVPLQKVPLYDIKILKSAEILFSDDNTESPISHITIPNLPKCDGAIYASSDSMYPLLKSGDIIIYKKITATIENIYWGEMYLITLINDDEDEFVMLRWIQKSDKAEDFVKLVSENKHRESKDLHISTIKGLALIKASIRINSMY
jgi:hypothetical protein